MKKLKFIGRLIFYVNILLAAITLIAYAAPYVSPIVFWPVAFLGLALPFLFIANFLFIIYWLFRAKSRFLLSLIILILGYKSIPSFIQLKFKSQEINKSDIKVMSFNVRVFDLYMWSKEKTTRNKIFDFLRAEDPDVLCLQEFYHTDVQNPNYEFKTLDTLTKILSAKNYHVHYTTTHRGTDHWGLITFSKFPIQKKGLVNFEIKDDNACIYTDIMVKNQLIRVYNTHLASIKLEKHDYKAMEKINGNEYSNGFDNELQLLGKIRYGFERRASQARAIQQSIENSPLPVVLCGDFNDTPSSFAYRTIKGNLKDAFIESGLGFGRTYIGEFPSFRIDYIFYDDQFHSKRYQTHEVELSDHHPVSTYISLP